MKNPNEHPYPSALPATGGFPYEVLSLVLQNIEERFLFVDLDFKIIAFNEISRNDLRLLLGREPFAGMDIMELVQPERKEIVRAIYIDVFAGKTRNSEVRYDQPDGSYRVFKNIFKPAHDADGRIIGAMVTVTDISAHHQKEEELRAAEHRLQSAMETANQGVWDWDMANDKIVWSNNYKLILGVDKEELGTTMADWMKRVHPEDRQRLTDHISDHSSSRDYYHESTYRVLNHQQEYKWILARAMILTRDDQGRSLRMIGTHSDISNWINKEQELKRSNERLTIAGRASSEGLWEWDIEEDHVYVNETYTEIFGWKVNENRRFDEWHDYIHPEDREDVIREYYLAIEDAKQDYWKREYRYLKSDGSYATISDKAAILRNQQGKATRVIGSSQDITSQKLIESMLKTSNERFKIVSRVTSDVIYDWNLEKDTLYWGEGLETLFGWDPRNFDSSSWINAMHPSEKSDIAFTIRRAIDGNDEHWEKEYRFRTSDNHYRYVLDKAYIMRDSQGIARRLIGSMQDISERRMSEELLDLERSVFAMSSDPRFSLAEVTETMILRVEHLLDMGIGICSLINDDGHLQPLAGPSIPLSLINILKGKEVQDLQGSCGIAIRTRQFAFNTDLKDPIWDDFRDILSPLGVKAGWSIPVILSNGQVRGCFTLFVNEERVPTQPELNVLERVRNLLRVLIEHSWAQNEIRLNNVRFDAIMKATHDLIWDWDIARDNMYRDALGVEKVYGVSDPQSIATVKNWIARVHPEDQALLRTLIDDIVGSKDQNNFDIEYRFLRDDGSYSYVYDRGILFRDAAGRAERMIGAAQDITERKKLEQELLKTELENQKAINQASVDSQEQERGEIGKELHDNVNQVLTTTKLYLDLAQTNPEMTAELLQKSVKNITSVINEIRQLSRSLMDPTIGDLGFLDSTRELIDSINLTRQLTVKLTADKGLEAFMNASQKLTLFRIIQEALNNTLKHAKATSVQINLRLEKQYIVMLIVDDGVGYDPVQIKRGAGLKNIQNRVYLIDGVHKFESAPGKGCRIIVRFPIKNDNQDK